MEEPKKHLTPEHKAKLSKAQTGKTWSQERKDAWKARIEKEKAEGRGWGKGRKKIENPVVNSSTPATSPTPIVTPVEPVADALPLNPRKGKGKTVVA